MKKILAIICCLGLTQLSFSQIKHKDNKRSASNAMYVELGGAAKAAYSINYDRIIAYSDPLILLVKTGVQFPSVDSEESYNNKQVFPVELAVLSGDNGYLEMGIGQVIAPDENIVTQKAPPYIRFAYRYQNEEGGIMMKLSLVSNLLKKKYKPWLGLAIGYSF